MIKKIKIPIYYGEFWIILLDDYDFEKAEKKYGMPKDKDGFYQSAYAAVSQKFNKKGVNIYSIMLQKKDCTIEIIAHEAKHIVNYIFQSKNIALDRYNDEPECYLLGWVVNEIIVFLNKKKIKIK